MNLEEKKKNAFKEIFVLRIKWMIYFVFEEILFNINTINVLLYANYIRNEIKRFISRNFSFILKTQKTKDCFLGNHII